MNTTVQGGRLRKVECAYICSKGWFSMIVTAFTSAIDMIPGKGHKGEPTEYLVEELWSSLRNSQVPVPESEGYAESTKRRSDAVEMRAVCE